MSNIKGQVLIELLVAVGVSVVLIPAIFSGFATSREGKPQQNMRLQAISLAEEALEAVRVIREADWENIKTNGNFHPEVSASSWILAAGGQTLGDFSRSLTISDVFRDANGNIAASGTLDPSIKKVDVQVSWGAPLASDVSLTAYLTRLTNEEYIDTTVADFEAGTHYNTTVTNIAGGEVQLGGGGKGNWCTPGLTIAGLDLPRQGDALAITAIPGEAYVGTGRDASGVSFAKVDISDTDPPVATSPPSNYFNGYKTNAVFGEEGYSYLATDTNSKEIVIIDLNTSPYAESGYFDAPQSQTDANSVFVLGSVGYMTAGSTLRTFDLTSKSGSRPQLGSVALSGTGTKVYVVGTYAYISVSGSSSREMEIVDVSNPASMSVIGYADTDSAGGVDLYVNDTGTRVYLATATSSTQREMFIINTETKTGGRLVVGSYDTNGMDPKGVRVVPGNRALIAGHSAEEYQAINIVDETNPVRCGGIDVDSGINGLWSVVEGDGDAYSYLVTQDADAEFRIIEGGPGGAFANTGVFTSRVFDVGHDTAFNRFLVTYNEPVDTQIKFQVGAGDVVGGVCDADSLTYVGPDKTSNTFYENGGLIPFDDDGFAYENPSRCFAYKVFLDANAGSPVFYDFTLNYSP